MQRPWGRNEQKGSQGGWTSGKKKWHKMGLKKLRRATTKPRERHWVSECPGGLKTWDNLTWCTILKNSSAFWKKQNHRDRNHISGFLGAAVGTDNSKGAWVNFGGWWKYLYLDCGVSYIVKFNKLYIYQVYYIEYILDYKIVNLKIYKLHKNSSVYFF